MRIKEEDLFRSLDWLAFVRKSHKQKRPQEHIDGRAINRVSELKGVLSADVLALYEDAIVEAFDSPKSGAAEACMTSACEFVVKYMATEENWREYISPLNIASEWRLIWEELRKVSEERKVELKQEWEKFSYCLEEYHEKIKDIEDWYEALTVTEQEYVKSWFV